VLSWRFSTRATTWRPITSRPTVVPLKTRNGSKLPRKICTARPVTAASSSGTYGRASLLREGTSWSSPRRSSATAGRSAVARRSRKPTTQPVSTRLPPP
jgi:hypothetical protein